MNGLQTRSTNTRKEMKVTWGIENVSRLEHTALTLGSFDGVHLGHQAILTRLNALKNEREVSRSLVLTFDPHPQEILRRNDTTISLLTTIDERLDLIAKSGIDETLVVEFTPELAATPYSQFFQNYIISAIGTDSMVVGFNHAFGKNREGDIAHLRALAAAEKIYVEETPPFFVGDVSVSSTKIRHALLSAESVTQALQPEQEGSQAREPELPGIETANSFLGRAYSLTGMVEEGDKIGRTLNFPTANILTHKNKLIPADGIYAGICHTQSGKYKAAISIGTRPTFTSTSERKIEAYLLGFEGDLYWENITVDFHSFIRHQEKFDGLDSLITQMQKDVAEVETRLRSKGL